MVKKSVTIPLHDQQAMAFAQGQLDHQSGIRFLLKKILANKEDLLWLLPEDGIIRLKITGIRVILGEIKGIRDT